MPNWCATNYYITGEKKDLEGLCSLLNSLKNHREPTANAFGPLWLGNLADTMGENWNQEGLRGTVDPDGYTEPCWGGPDSNLEMEFETDGKTLRLSTVTAWSRSRKFETMLRERFPSLEFVWQTTDDCGNFFTTNDAVGVEGFERYHISNGDHYEFFKKDKFLEKFRELCPGFDIPENITDKELMSDEFVSKFCDWREADISRSMAEYYVYILISDL